MQALVGTLLIGSLILMGLVLILAEPSSDEKTELEVLTRQVRGLGYLLASMILLYIGPRCIDSRP